MPEHERARAPKRDQRRPAERGGKPGTRHPRGDRKSPGGRGRGPRPPRPMRANRPVPTLSGPSGFTPLGVPDIFAAVLQQQGITDPYPIQHATIPEAIAGRDILGRGRTGSGKTLAFGLPLITRLSKGGPLAARRSPRGLVLVPTRELAAQVMDVLRPLTDAVGLDVCLVIGGASYDKQISRLSNGTDIVVATPGRLFDLTERGAADLSHISTVVIDEADQMADMGFLPQVEVLLDQVPSHGQRLLFSATLDDGVDALVTRYLRAPREHATDPDTAVVATMEHKVVVLPHAKKPEHAAGIARAARRTLVFVRTRTDAEVIAEQLGDLALSTDVLHGGMSQRARSRALDGFRAGRTSVLVATDVAARGIHVDDISVVLQLDPPRDHKDYLHRAGRTARAGATGTVITLAAPHQQRGLQRLLERAGVIADVDYLAPRPRPGARTHGHGTPRRPASRFDRRAS